MCAISASPSASGRRKEPALAGLVDPPMCSRDRNVLRFGDLLARLLSLNGEPPIPLGHGTIEGVRIRTLPTRNFYLRFRFRRREQPRRVTNNGLEFEICEG